jgi:hypothetical protein
METLYALSGLLKLGAILIGIKILAVWVSKILAGWRNVK